MPARDAIALNARRLAALAPSLLLACAGCTAAPPRELASSWTGGDATRSITLEDGVSLRYLKTGNGPPLVLLHTLRTQLDYFQRIIPALRERYTVYAIDLPGHGRSSIPGARYDEPFFRKSVAALLRGLDLRDVTLAGESIGGTLALTVAATDPGRIRRVVSINPYDYGERFGGGIRRSAGGWIIGFFAAFGPYTPEPAFLLSRVIRGGFDDASKAPDDLLEELHSSGSREGFRAAEYSLFSHWRSWLAARELYGAVRVPVTLVYSSGDWSLPAEREANRRRLAGARRVEIAGAGHFVSLERPDEVVAAIDRDAGSRGPAAPGYLP
jgi:pimeloyl-ACP methyl ester carboxylesterase